MKRHERVCRAIGFAALMDRIVEFECDLMRMAARRGFHGIHFADDWGTQSGMMISPALWRRLFKPHYARQAFLIPISYQTVSIRGTPEEIRAETRRLHRLLSTPERGFIGYVEEYGVMGMSEENYRACGDAFRGLRSCNTARR